MVYLGGRLRGTNLVPEGLSFSILLQKGDFASTCFQLKNLINSYRVTCVGKCPLKMNFSGEKELHEDA